MKYHPTDTHLLSDLHGLPNPKSGCLSDQRILTMYTDINKCSMKCIIGTVPPQTLIKNQLSSTFLSVIQISGQHKIIILKYSPVLLCKLQTSTDIFDIRNDLIQSFFICHFQSHLRAHCILSEGSHSPSEDFCTGSLR